MFAEVNGIRMSYQDRGEGEPVVIIGGFGTNGAFWDPVMGMLISISPRRTWSDGPWARRWRRLSHRSTVTG